MNAIDIRPANWDGFAEVMGEKGGCGGCWCMLWRQSAAEMAAQKGAGNKAAMKSVFAGDIAPGLVAWDGKRPVGWISVAPRAEFPRLARSRVMAPVDEVPVWVVSCFLIDKAYRRQGLSVAMLEAAADFAQSHGAPALEGYPLETDNPNYTPVYAWVGLAPAFRRAGFSEIARRSENRPVMRRAL